MPSCSYAIPPKAGKAGGMVLCRQWELTKGEGQMLRGIAAYVRRHHIALLALFFALGGTAFAAGNALLPKNSVGTAQLKNGAVVKTKIAKKTLAQLKGNKGAQGAPGPAGP